MAERQLPKLHTRVRFPSPAPTPVGQGHPASVPSENLQLRPSAKVRTGERLEQLDVIRGVAIILVFWYHVLGSTFGRFAVSWDGLIIDPSDRLLLLWPATLGWAGVAIFFALSGYCIHSSFMKSTGSLYEYFIRRIFRIYPPYLAAVIIFSVVWYPGTRQIVTHLGLVHNFSADTFFGISPAFWSIAVEAQLYLLYPLLFLIASRFGWTKMLVSTLVVEFALRAWKTGALIETGQPLPWMIEGNPLYYIFSWTIGAYLAQRKLVGERRNHFGVLGAVFLLAGTLAPISKFTVTFSFPLFALATCFAIAFHAGKPRRADPPPLAARLTGMIGRDSYSMYLLHQPLLGAGMSALRAISWLPMSLRFFLGGGVLFIIIAAISSINRRIVEDTSIAIGRQLLRKSQERTTSSAIT
jgi:peptidoglycan/LPS O-acetylase OafA/YrhL